MSEQRNNFEHIEHPRKRAFLRAFAECGSLRVSTEAAQIVRQTHHNWLKDDPEYAAAFEDAKADAADRLEEEARRRAADGVRRLVTYKGQPVMVPEDFDNPDSPQVPLYEHQYSDVLLIFLLKALRPEKYRERTENLNVNINKHAFEPTSGPPPWLMERAEKSTGNN